MSSGQIVTVRQYESKMNRWFEARGNMLSDLGADPKRLASIALTELRAAPRLLQCIQQNEGSFYAAIVKATQLGLEFGSHLGHAYLTPRFGRKPGVVLVVGYKGVVYLLWRDSKILARSFAVYDGDDFEFSTGTEDVVKHTRRFKSEEPIAFYARAKVPDGRLEFEVMSAEEINKIRNGVMSWEKTPWATNYDEMAKKTVLKRLSKQLPISPAAQAAITLDDRVDVNLSQNLENEFHVDVTDETNTAEPIGTIDEPVTTGDGWGPAQSA